MADSAGASGNYPTIVDSDTMAKSNVDAFNKFVGGLPPIEDQIQQPDQFRQWANQQIATLPTIPASPSPDTQDAARSQDTTPPPAPAAPTDTATPTTPPAPSDASSFSKWANNQAQSILGPLSQTASGVKQDVTSAAATVGQDVNNVAASVGITPPSNTPTPSLRDRNLISNQFTYQQDQELTPEEAASACGPTAALAFARFQGRNPTIGEALALAKKNGWTPSLGMAGPNSEVSLLGQLGVESQYNQDASAQDVAQEISQGRPVIVDTPNHYYAIDDYNAQNGLYHVGGSGLALRGGSEWMSWDQITKHGGGVRGDITIKGGPNTTNDLDQIRQQVAPENQSYVDDAVKAAQAQGVDPNTFVKQLFQESGFNPKAGSNEGAKGIAQFTDATAQDYGIDAWNAKDSINAAAKYMAQSLKNNNGDVRLALAAYNAGQGNVNKYGQKIFDPAYLKSQGWSDEDANQPLAYVTRILGGNQAPSNTVTPTSSNTSETSNITHIVSQAVHPQVQAFNDFVGNLPSLNDILGLGGNYGTTPDNGMSNTEQGPSQNSYRYNDMAGTGNGAGPSFGSNPEDATSPIDQARTDNSMPQVLGGPTPASNLLSQGWNTFQAATNIPRQIIQASYNPAVGHGFKEAWDYLNAGMPNSAFSASPQSGQSVAQLAETSTTGPESILGGISNFSRQIIDGWQRSDPNQPIINRIDQATKLADTQSDQTVASESDRLESNLGPNFGPVAASAFRFSYNTLTDPMMVTVLESRAAQIGIPVGGLLFNIYGHATGQTPQQIEDLTLTGMNLGSMAPIAASLIEKAPSIAKGAVGIAKGVGQGAADAARGLGEIADRTGVTDQVSRLGSDTSGMVGRQPETEPEVINQLKKVIGWAKDDLAFEQASPYPREEVINRLKEEISYNEERLNGSSSGNDRAAAQAALTPKSSRTKGLGAGTVKVGQTPDFYRELAQSQYPGAINKAIVKETVQNSVDASRDIPGAVTSVDVDSYTHTIHVTDQGHGMTPEVLENQFSKFGGSFKPSENSSGGKGTAKAAFLGNADQFGLRTVARDPESGKLVESILYGTGDEYLTTGLHRYSALAGRMPESQLNKLPPQLQESWPVDARGRPQTGTSMLVQPLKSSEWDDEELRKYVNMFNTNHTLTGQSVHFSIDRQPFEPYSDEEAAHQLRWGNDVTPANEFLKTIDTPTATLKVYSTKNIQEGSVVKTVLMNHGQPQVEGHIYMANNAKLPTRLSVDVIPKFDPREAGKSPWSPDRNALTNTVQRALDDYVQNDLTNQSNQKENDTILGAVKDGVPIRVGLKLPTAPNIRIMDPTSSIQREDLASIAHSPYIVPVAEMLATLHNFLEEKLVGKPLQSNDSSWMMDPSQFLGLGTSNKWIGLNVHGDALTSDFTRAGMSGHQILINPWLMWTEAKARVGSSGKTIEQVGDVWHLNDSQGNLIDTFNSWGAADRARGDTRTNEIYVGKIDDNHWAIGDSSGNDIATFSSESEAERAASRMRSDESSPQYIQKLASAMSEQFIGTMLHEMSHNTARTHDVNFAGALTRLPQRFGYAKLGEMADNLTSMLTDVLSDPWVIRRWDEDTNVVRSAASKDIFGRHGAEQGIEGSPADHSVNAQIRNASVRQGVGEGVPSADAPLRNGPASGVREGASVDAAVRPDAELGRSKSGVDQGADRFFHGEGTSDIGVYPPAGSIVDGRKVRPFTPNQDSIDASLNGTDYEILPGVREVQTKYFDAPPEITKRTKDLAEQIQQSKEISPLIVAIDSQGPYILEGGHRYDALKILGAKSFPAIVVAEDTARAVPSGTRLGSPPAIGGAIVGGLYGYNSDPNATPEQKAKNAMLGAATGATLGHVASGGKLGLSIEDVGKPVENRVLGSLTEADNVAKPGKSYQLQNRLMDLKDMIVSNRQGDFSQNPEYPQEFQDRNRTAQSSKEQVSNITTNFDPKQVTHDYTRLELGTPVVGSDNIVESGNGRAMALREIQSGDPKKWQAYQDAVKKEALKSGFTEEDLAKFENPVLVRERVDPMTHSDRVKFAQAANGRSGLGMGGFEVARQDAKRLPDDVLDQLHVDKNENLTTAISRSDNAEVRDAYVQSMPFNDRGSIMNSQGKLSPVGVARLRDAIIAKIFHGPEGEVLASLMVDVTDSKLKNIQAGITGALLPLAKAESLITSGARDASLSITEDLARAVRVLNKVRTDRIPLKDYLGQKSFDDMHKLTPAQEKLVNYLDKTGNKPFPLKDLLTRYANEVEGAAPSGQMDFFGESTKADKVDIINKIIEAQRKDGVFGLKKATAVPKEKPAAPAVPLTADEQSAAHMQGLAEKFLTDAAGTPEQAEALRPDEPGHIGNVLLKNVPKDTLPYLQKILDDVNQFGGQRRGVQKDADVIANAKANPTSIEEFLKIKPGKAFTDVQVQTLKNAINVYDGQLTDLKLQQEALTKANGDPSSALELAIVRKTLELRALIGVYTGAAAEGGRTLRSFAIATGDNWNILYRAQKKAAAHFGVDPSVERPPGRNGRSPNGTTPFDGTPSRLPTPEELAKMRAENEGARQGAMPPGKDIPVSDPSHVWTPEEKAAFKHGASGAQQGTLTPDKIGSDHPLTPEERAAFKAGVARAQQGTLIPTKMGSDHIWSPEEAEAWQLGAKSQSTLGIDTKRGMGQPPSEQELAAWKSANGREPTQEELDAFRLGVQNGSQPTLGLKTDQVAGLAPTAEEIKAWKTANGREPTPEELDAWKLWKKNGVQLDMGLDATATGGASNQKRLEAAYKSFGTNAEQFHSWMDQWDKVAPGDTLGRYKLLQALGKPSAMRYIIAYGISNMLSSTHTLGIVGIHGGLMAVNRPVLEALKGNPVTAASDIAGMARFTGEALSNAALYFREGMHSTGVEQQLREGQLDFQRDPFPGAQGIFVTPAARTIGAIHEFYTTLSYGGALMLEAQKESKISGRSVKALLDNPTDSMLKNATERAHDDLSGGKPSWAAQQILNARNTAYNGKTPQDKAAGLLMNGMLPFVRIPDYLLRNGAKIAMSPVWYPATAGAHLVKAGRLALKGESAIPELVKAQGDLRVGAVSSLILWEMYQQALQGNITGAGPSDPNRLAVLEQATNPDGSKVWQAHSIRVGNRWVDYSTLGGVLTVPLVVVAGIAEAKKEDKVDNILASAVRQANSFTGQGEQATPDDTKFFNDVGSNMAKSMMDVSYIRTIGDMFKSIQDGHAWGALASPLIINPAEAMIPLGSAAAETARIQDPNAKAPGSMFQQIETRVPKLPLMGDNLPNITHIPNRVGALGGDVSSPQDIVSAASPGKTTGGGAYDPAMHELARLDASGNPVSLRVTSATQQGYGGPYQGTLQTPEQMRQIQQQMGSNAQRYITNAMNQPGYAALDDAKKAKTLNDAIAASDKQSNLALGNDVTRDPPHQAALAWDAVPKYASVSGTPDEIRQKNLQISDAQAKLLAYEKDLSLKHPGSAPAQMHGQALYKLSLEDPNLAYLARIPRLNAKYLQFMHQQVDTQFNGALTQADQQGLTGTLQTYLPLDTTQNILNTIPSGG